MHSLSMLDMSGVSFELEPTLRQMLAPAASSRPPAVVFAGCQFFQGDVQLRALKV